MEDMLTYNSVTLMALDKMSKFENLKTEVHFEIFEEGIEDDDFKIHNIFVEGCDENNNNYSLFLHFNNRDEHGYKMFDEISEKFITWLSFGNFTLDHITISTKNYKVLYEHYGEDGDKELIDGCMWVVDLLQKQFEEELKQRRIKEDKEERIKKEKMLAEQEKLKKVVEILGF